MAPYASGSSTHGIGSCNVARLPSLDAKDDCPQGEIEFTERPRGPTNAKLTHSPQASHTWRS